MFAYLFVAILLTAAPSPNDTWPGFRGGWD